MNCINRTIIFEAGLYKFECYISHSRHVSAWLTFALIDYS